VKSLAQDLLNADCMKPTLALVLLGLLGASTAHAAASNGMTQALNQATSAMKAARYQGSTKRAANAAQRRRDGVQTAMLELINNAPFLRAFDKVGETLVLAKGKMGHELFLAVSPEAPRGGRIGLYSGIERRMDEVGQIPAWLDNYIELYPKLTAASLTASVRAWTKQNFPSGKAKN
jgi:hypothetical protein